MKRIFKIIILLLIVTTSKAQYVKYIKNQYQAKYRVFITNKPKDADQWIFRVKNPTDIRKAAEWYIVENIQLFKEAMTLYKVDKKEDADLIVYYVSTRDSAMIRNNNQQK